MFDMVSEEILSTVCKLKYEGQYSIRTITNEIKHVVKKYEYINKSVGKIEIWIMDNLILYIQVGKEKFNIDKYIPE